ncbi:MAG: TIR domain-containing protein, partial [Lachnospiraceae bacterium]|nr:TIR domain-containing protein [Lachnospiraceae bacterium]
MGKEYKFDAFISYRHTEPDQFAAQLLHKRLEAFKLPKNVVSKLGPDGRKKISRVFRDQEELPLASNLADTITEALNESDFLIVICTPRLPESRWCRKEITTFLENHDRTHVLAVLLEGEPEQSFPEELRFIDEEITREDGTKETVRREIEPLAADFRGNTHKEISKKMDLEILRLLAPMFGVDFDDLRQRHRERKMKRIIRISAAISAVFFTFALVSTTMALRINKQNIEIQNKNTEIQQQNEEIQKQNDEIQEQNDKIEEQYREVLRSESTILATRSLNELDSGDRYKAIETALEALPGAPGKEDRPVVADAEYALTRALYVYDNGAAYRSQQMLEMQTSVAAITLSPEGDRFLGTDQAGNVMVWEGKTGKRLAKIQTNRTTFNDKDEAIFLDNDHIAVLSKDGFAVVDVPARETLYQNQDGSVYGLYTNRKGLLGAKGYNTAYLYDSMSGELKMEFPYPENSSLQGMFFDPDGKYVAFALNVVPENDDEWQKRYTLVEIYDATTLEKVQTIKRSHAMIYWVRLEGDSAYVAYADMIPVTADFSNFYSNFDYEGLVEKVSVPTAKTLWKNQSGDLCKMLSTARDGSWDYILSKSYQSIAFFNKEDGSLINRQEYESAIADLAFNADGSIVTVITTDGERHLYQPYNGNDIVYLDTFLVPCETVRNALFGTDYVAIRTTNSKSIYLMGRSEGTGYEPVWDNVDSSCLFAQFSHDGKYVITYDGSTDSHMNLVDLTTGNILRTLERDNGLST